MKCAFLIITNFSVDLLASRIVRYRSIISSASVRYVSIFPVKWETKFTSEERRGTAHALARVSCGLTTASDQKAQKRSGGII